MPSLSHCVKCLDNSSLDGGLLFPAMKSHLSQVFLMPSHCSSVVHNSIIIRGSVIGSFAVLCYQTVSLSKEWSLSNQNLMDWSLCIIIFFRLNSISNITRIKQMASFFVKVLCFCRHVAFVQSYKLIFWEIPHLETAAFVCCLVPCRSARLPKL